MRRDRHTDCANRQSARTRAAVGSLGRPASTRSVRCAVSGTGSARRTSTVDTPHQPSHRSTHYSTETTFRTTLCRESNHPHTRDSYRMHIRSLWATPREILQRFPPLSRCPAAATPTAAALYAYGSARLSGLTASSAFWCLLRTAQNAAERLGDAVQET